MSEKWRSKLHGDPVPWLLESNSWTKYRTMTDLLELPVSSSEVVAAKQALCDDPQIQSLIEETMDWIPKAPTRNSDPKISYFKLRALADFGLTIDDVGIRKIAEKASEHLDHDMFAVRGTLPKRVKKGEKVVKQNPETDEWHASPCNSPIITYALLSLGLNNNQIDKTVAILKEKWGTEQGWFCHFFFVNGMFKKLQMGCQMAGLMALDVFSQIPELKESNCAKNAYAPIKFHKEYGKTMYYFGRSKKFHTLKYPFVWYNALYLAEVLTRFDFLKGESLVQELVTWIEGLQNEEGRFKPTSMFNIYKGWDFANKKENSPWITFLCCRILKQWYGS